jgi:hypothetical protein
LAAVRAAFDAAVDVRAGPPHRRAIGYEDVCERSARFIRPL